MIQVNREVEFSQKGVPGPKSNGILIAFTDMVVDTDSGGSLQQGAALVEDSSGKVRTLDLRVWDITFKPAKRPERA